MSKSDIPAHVTAKRGNMDSIDAADLQNLGKAVSSLPHILQILADPEQLALATAVGIFGKAFLQTLGQRVGDGAADIPKQLRDLARDRKRTRKGEATLGAGDEVAASIVVAADLPDEARLALLDLDVTATELRGKLLRWDRATSAWQAAGDQ